MEAAVQARQRRITAEEFYELFGGRDFELVDGVVVTVDDEGEGIPVDLRRRVFTKFWKGGARGGSGLGLYIVGGLTKAHGGTVTIEDAPGGGARIAVAWPSSGPEPGI